VEPEEGEPFGSAVARALRNDASTTPSLGGARVEPSEPAGAAHTLYDRLLARLTEENLPASAPLVDAGRRVRVEDLERVGAVLTIAQRTQAVLQNGMIPVTAVELSRVQRFRLAMEIEPATPDTQAEMVAVLDAVARELGVTVVLGGAGGVGGPAGHPAYPVPGPVKIPADNNPEPSTSGVRRGREVSDDLVIEVNSVLRGLGSLAEFEGAGDGAGETVRPELSAMRPAAEDGFADNAPGDVRLGRRAVVNDAFRQTVLAMVRDEVAALQGNVHASRLLPRARELGYSGSDRNFRQWVAKARDDWRAANGPAPLEGAGLVPVMGPEFADAGRVVLVEVRGADGGLQGLASYPAGEVERRRAVLPRVPSLGSYWAWQAADGGLSVAARSLPAGSGERTFHWFSHGVAGAVLIAGEDGGLYPLDADELVDLVGDRLRGFDTVRVWSCQAGPVPDREAALRLAARINARTGYRVFVPEWGTALDENPGTGGVEAHTLPGPDGGETGWISAEDGGVVVGVPAAPAFWPSYPEPEFHNVNQALLVAADRGSIVETEPGLVVYRWLETGPSEVFVYGLRPKNPSNMEDLLTHLGSSGHTQFVSTTLDKGYRYKNRRYIYTVRLSESGIDVAKTLAARGLSYLFSWEKEVAVTGTIPPEDIVEVRDMQTGEVIPNPNYRPRD
jgi:hypothetical protein